MTQDRGAERRPIEESIAVVSDWVSLIEISQSVSEISTTLVREVLEHYGARFEGLNDEAQAALKPDNYSTNHKKEGIEAIWGERYNEYKAWAKNWAEEYEATTGQALPKIPTKKDGKLTGGFTKTSGMNQLFQQLTEYAAGTLPFEDFKRFTEVRLMNGIAWAEGRKQDRVRVVTPNDGKEHRIGSVPPEFLVEMWNYIKTWKKAS